jgi:hypothetical protein
MDSQRGFETGNPMEFLGKTRMRLRCDPRDLGGAPATVLCNLTQNPSPTKELRHPSTNNST